ncbi:MAG: hypothetical protein U0L88_04885 [Acutalibacteraceae bacterium]|nr:hypothetical protein [Acutalibacteraceae bacterium]
MDWNKLKAEYIAGGTSYRKLAEKYKDEGVTFNNLKLVAKKEEWAKLRKQAMDKATTKMVNTVANDISKKNTKINDVADKLLDKISSLLDDFEMLDTQGIKHLTSSLKDIKDIKGIKSDIDLREQEARIDKLRKDAMEEQTDTSVIVKFKGDIEEWSK